jgi:hypothetical protein
MMMMMTHCGVVCSIIKPKVTAGVDAAKLAVCMQWVEAILSEGCHG